VIGGQCEAGPADPTVDDPYTQAKWPNLPRIVYEVDAASGRIEPRLRLWIDSPISLADSGGSTPGPSSSTSSNAQGIDRPNIGLLWALQQGPWVLTPDTRQNSVIVVEPSIAHISEVK
jgi:hypothetical protein